MEIWRSAKRLSTIALVFTFLLACSPIVESGEHSVVDPQSQVTPETAGAAEELDDVAESHHEGIPSAEGEVEDIQGQEADVPNLEFDPENTKDGMEMVYVPEGEFPMGTSDEQRDRLIEEDIWDSNWNTNEQPIHTVYLDAFWIDKTEVTNEQYALCVADGACQEAHSSASATRVSYYGNPEFRDYPAVYIDWSMAKAYCAWAGRRLPSEAEWEKAARGTDERLYPWGDEIDNTLANYGGSRRKNSDTTAVGSYLNGASPYGALDMAGNVQEWVADIYDFTYYSKFTSCQPIGACLGFPVCVPWWIVDGYCRLSPRSFSFQMSGRLRRFSQ